MFEQADEISGRVSRQVGLCLKFWRHHCHPDQRLHTDSRLRQRLCFLPRRLSIQHDVVSLQRNLDQK
jgi:hypothetical protein